MSAGSTAAEVDGLTKRFADRHARCRPDAPAASRPVLTALDNVDISSAPGETLGVVGESGSGKSTLARCIVRLYEPDAGSVDLRRPGRARRPSGAELRALRRSIQMIYQDPYSSLNPRMRVGDAVAEPARVHGLIEKGEEERYAIELLERVGIRSESVKRYPHEFSGGQRQRIAIARSLAVKPRLLIADEAVSALDVSIQAQLLALLEEIRRDLGLTMIFISHQLAVISRLADRVAIMYLGRVVETGATADVFADPRHPVHADAARGASRRSTAPGCASPACRPRRPSPYAIPQAAASTPAARSPRTSAARSTRPPSRSTPPAAATSRPATCCRKRPSGCRCPRRDRPTPTSPRSPAAWSSASSPRSTARTRTALPITSPSTASSSTSATASRINGKADFLEDLLGLFTAVPDFHVAESRVIAEGGVVAAEIQLAGTPASEWRGFEPTGRPFVWDTCSFYDLHEDREHLLRERMYYDAAALEAQLAA